jgi:hypothetical protein
MRLSVDTSVMRFISSGPPEPTLDFETRAPKLDDEGRAIFQVHLFVVVAGGQELMTVKVAGEPKGIGEFTPVKVSELVATTWAMGDRSGVSFRAEKIEATTPARQAAGSSASSP